ncbi:HigA family addiction module antidote protein [Sodalis ligni]|jgi:addiction module HigA family antidote|uniref:Addiction module HigA family antidote n=1 Tax=Sodalis ligni TaxID=2697027 RepID=A0A4R1NG77_9GAMM|nr:HigA family addiction module antitoxin [Sodalis ligni]QWA12795.1 HigA family addiction module antidote protein [Sodalis ligni]TCL03686.1 addiction module HigA family antidote [Sodalis ligni]
MTMFNPPHPGEIIAETLDDLNIGIRELSRALHVAPSTVQRLVSGHSAVSPEMALKLSAVLGSSAKFWLNLQDNYSLWAAQKEVDISKLHRLVAVA